MKTNKTCTDGTRNHEHCETLKDSKGDDVCVCHDCKQTLGKITEVYSRVVGYLRPVSGWNKGKQAEFKLRTPYLIKTPK